MFTNKILYLGANITNTDIMVSKLASANNTINHGLITTADFVPLQPGYYHTTVVDISLGGIVQLAKQFDEVILLDQPMDQWPHWKPLLSTYRILLELEQMGYKTAYKDNENIKNFTLFYKMVTENKSFCIYPWILLTQEYNVVPVCTRSSTKVTTLAELKDWRSNPGYKTIRQSMLAGDLLPDHCWSCYDYENKNIESSRIYETMDWVSKLNLKSLDDLDKITAPYYYEIRLGNTCNLLCRSCKPEHSHLIDREFKKFNIVFPQLQSFSYSNFDHVDIDAITPHTRIYVAGGEPTVIPAFFEFMQKCIDHNRTDFDFAVGTNAVKISNKLLDLASHFPNINFSVSVDGYGRYNDYQRWGSDFAQVIENAHKLANAGHAVSFLCVPGMYNITNLHLLLELLDKEFPGAGLYLQINHMEIQSPFNHPKVELVLDSLERCRQTKTYYTDGRSCKSTIDSLYEHYSNNPQCDFKLLKEFFDYNDKLDHARGVRLVDYIPELEECRKFI